VARLEIQTGEHDTAVVVTLSRRNLLALLHKLDMPGSAREIRNGDCHLDGRYAPALELVLRSETDSEHYAKRPAPPGGLHPQTETFVRRHGGWSALKG
jgi:hypothetical protein